ncbi:MAG TPA: hypothetical protein VH249_24220 [Xanthobacteraceae bacterium]|jgi:hypothetical protein|nr:hypothetical protein [Xanthobacteraceae bacterium]
MRFFLGMIVGALLTIGVAYISDASISGTMGTTTTTTTGAGGSTQVTVERPMVNWDVVSTNWHHFTVGVQNTWHKLASR